MEQPSHLPVPSTAAAKKGDRRDTPHSTATLKVPDPIFKIALPKTTHYLIFFWHSPAFCELPAFNSIIHLYTVSRSKFSLQEPQEKTSLIFPPANSQTHLNLNFSPPTFCPPQKKKKTSVSLISWKGNQSFTCIQYPFGSHLYKNITLFRVRCVVMPSGNQELFLALFSGAILVVLMAPCMVLGKELGWVASVFSPVPLL